MTRACAARVASSPAARGSGAQPAPLAAPFSALAAALVAGLLAAPLLAGCGDATGSSQPPFEPVEYGRTVVRAAGEAGPGELANRFLSPGAAFEVTEYEVPDLLCVRTDTDDLLHVPEDTRSPGGPAVFWAVAPADRTQPVLIAFHGNGLDFIEAEASLLAHEKPELAAALLASDPNNAGYIEIDNRGGALRGLKGELGNTYVAEALERGWGLVVPGNCWGDGGHGAGEIVDYYIRAPRQGRWMDDGTWSWYRAHFAHDASREYSFGCSGGGQRTAQLLLHDPDATAASGVDSPADYLPGFLDELPDLFSLLADLPEHVAVLEDFYTGHYGSLAGAAEQSLGTQLLARRIATPMWMSWSRRDGFAKPAVTERLADALAAREPDDRAYVWETGEPVHCQVNTRERAHLALDWLAQWEREPAD